MEYTVVVFGKDDWSVSITNQLNIYAAYGWKIVACVCREEQILYTLERKRT